LYLAFCFNIHLFSEGTQGGSSRALPLLKHAMWWKVLADPLAEGPLFFPPILSLALKVGPDNRTIKQEVDGEACCEAGAQRFVRPVRVKECLCEARVFDEILRKLTRQVCLLDLCSLIGI
jgi:hypothetical protein